MRPISIAAPRGITMAAVLLAALTCFCGIAQPATAQNPQLEKRGAQGGGTQVVLSARRLSPPLHSGNRRVAFSPDGKYLLAQDDSGVSLFTRSPLAQKFRVTADDVVPAAFTADSRQIVIASNSVQYEIVSVEGNGAGEQKQLSAGADNCLFIQLSAAGNTEDCLMDDGSLHFFEVSSGKETGKVQAFSFPNGIFVIEPMSEPSAFSEPFGIAEEHTHRGGAAGRMLGEMIVLSPDGRYALWESPQSGLEGFDLSTNAKLKVPGSLKSKVIRSVKFVSPTQILAMDPEKANATELIEFPSGKTLSKPRIAGTFARTSSANYVIHRAPGSDDADLVDLTTAKVVAEKVELGSDVRDNEIATSDKQGVVSIRHLQDDKKEQADAAAGWTSPLKAGFASADLSAFAAGTGDGTVYSSATGNSVATFDNAIGAWCDAANNCYITVKGKKAGAYEVEKVEMGSGKTTAAWSHAAPAAASKWSSRTFPPEQDEPSGEVLFEYGLNVEDEMHELGAAAMHEYLHPPVGSDTMRIPSYQLRALEIETGKELWKRRFNDEPPVPFSDPQGDRVVLGWMATSAGGKKAAKENPVAAPALKADKKSTHDVYFEILDARSGKTVGGALVPSNAPANTFDEAFSEGDWLVLARDGQRVIVESLSTGQEVLKLRGWWPSIERANGFLAVSPEETRVDIYDLKSGDKLKDYHFPAPVAYTRFSADGKKMLVLTRDQQVFVLDVSAVRVSTASGTKN